MRSVGGIYYKPRSPSELRDVPCGRAPAGTFDIPDRGPTPTARRARKYRLAVAQSYCNGVPGRAGCPFKLSCLAWALAACETGVYGGIEVTKTHLRNRSEVLEREVERAREKAGASPDRTRQLAEPGSGRQTG